MYMYIWWFPEIGLPPNYHPVSNDVIFHDINHPASWGDPHITSMDRTWG